MKDCEDSLVGCEHEMSDIVENVRICGTVNSTRQCQIEVRIIIGVLVSGVPLCELWFRCVMRV